MEHLALRHTGMRALNDHCFSYLKSNIRSFESEGKTVLSLQKDSLRKPSWRNPEYVFSTKSSNQIICLLWKIMSEADSLHWREWGVPLDRAGHWVRNIFLFATSEWMPVINRSLFGRSYFIYLKQYQLWNSQKRQFLGDPPSCSAVGVWSSSPGRLSVLQLLHTDNCSWPALKGYQALHFQISCLHKSLLLYFRK